MPREEGCLQPWLLPSGLPVASCSGYMDTPPRGHPSRPQCHAIPSQGSGPWGVSLPPLPSHTWQGGSTGSFPARSREVLGRLVHSRPAVHWAHCALGPLCVGASELSLLQAFQIWSCLMPHTPSPPGPCAALTAVPSLLFHHRCPAPGDP